jgi:N-acetylglucosamine-6-phosphate deacetylase
VVTPEGVLDGAWVRILDGRIVEVGSGATRVSAVAFHLAHGVTRTFVSLMARPVDTVCEQLGWVAPLVHDEVITGAHLEGPFLAEARCGAQNPGNLLDPDPLVLAKRLEAGQGSVQTVTLAPELPGAVELITELAAGGVVAAPWVPSANERPGRPSRRGRSTLTMDEAVRRAVSDVGLPIDLASAAGSGNPARVLGIDSRCGSIRAGLDADLLVLDADFTVRRVMKLGRWV